MDIKTSLRFLRWLFITLSICLGGVLGLAQTKAAQTSKPTAPAPVERWRGGQKTIIDAAGRPHVRHERITYAQRKAAAQHRLQALRQAAAKKKQAEVKQ
jgi:hypothetical protein